MNKTFQVGDWVIARDYFYGQITNIDGDVAVVEFELGYDGGGSMPFYIGDLEHTGQRREYPDITYVRNFSVGGNSIERTCSLSLWNTDEEGNEVDSTTIHLTQGELKGLIKSLQVCVVEKGAN
jgi:signal peptidase I